MKKLVKITILVSCLLFVPLLSACDRDGAMEDVGEKVDETVEETGEAIEETTE
ncbi:MAG: hypothetical protein ABR523_10960 [Desulfurivibrionaceae bacterium]